MPDPTEPRPRRGRLAALAAVVAAVAIGVPAYALAAGGHGASAETRNAPQGTMRYVQGGGSGNAARQQHRGHNCPHMNGGQSGSGSSLQGSSSTTAL
jgi:hypothetical protein